MGSLPTTHAAQPFIEQMPAAIAIFDGGMLYRAVSRRYLSDLAWLFSAEVLPPDKVIGRTLYELSPDAPPRWRDVHARALAGEELAQEEELVLRPDGGAVWVRWSMKPWRTRDGRIGGGAVFIEVVFQEGGGRAALPRGRGPVPGPFREAAGGIGHVARG